MELFGLTPVRNPAYNPLATEINTLENSHLGCATGGRAFTFSSWRDCHRISKAARRFCAVTSLTLVDFHRADVTSAGYRLCTALRLGGVAVALDRAGPAFRSCSTACPSTMGLDATSHTWGPWNLYGLSRAGAWKAQDYPIQKAPIHNNWSWFPLSGTQWFCGMTNSLTTPKIMSLFKVISCNDLYKHCKLHICTVYQFYVCAHWFLS